MPSSVPDGGIRMSVTITSGCRRSIAERSSVAFEHTPTSSTCGAALSIVVSTSRMR
jgi:hypothetical protein